MESFADTQIRYSRIKEAGSCPDFDADSPGLIPFPSSSSGEKTQYAFSQTFDRLLQRGKNFDSEAPLCQFPVLIRDSCGNGDAPERVIFSAKSRALISGFIEGPLPAKRQGCLGLPPEIGKQMGYFMFVHNETTCV
jgi:hypothetical protein